MFLAPSAVGQSLFLAARNSLSAAEDWHSCRSNDCSRVREATEIFLEGTSVLGKSLMFVDGQRFAKAIDGLNLSRRSIVSIGHEPIRQITALAHAFLRLQRADALFDALSDGTETRKAGLDRIRGILQTSSPLIAALPFSEERTRLEELQRSREMLLFLCGHLKTGGGAAPSVERPSYNFSVTSSE